NSRTPSTRSFIPSMLRMSEGGASTSHKHQRGIPLMNSSEPTKGRTYFFAVGFSAKNCCFSASERTKKPPSTCLLPFTTGGTSQIGVEREVTARSEPSMRYGLILRAIEVTTFSEVDS